MEKIKDRYSDIEKLREKYEKLKIEYNLPDFSELNKIFDIEELDVETEFLLRKIRRVISERIAGYSRFIEIILNPSNAPIFFFKLFKKFDKEDLEFIGKIYENLGNLEIESMSLDLDYSEKKEANFINKIFRIFNEEIKQKFSKIISKLSSSGNNNLKNSNGSYFG